MNTRHSTSTITQPTDTIIHPVFHAYMSDNVDGLIGLGRAIATHAVGRSIILAATGARHTSIVMPTLRDAPRCVCELPSGTWVMDGAWRTQMDKYPEKFLEYVCYQVGGATAGFVFDDGDHHSELGLGDIEESFGFCKSFESVHKISESKVFAGCITVAEQLLAQYYNLAETMVQRLVKQRSLCRHDMSDYLSEVRETNVGMHVLAAIHRPENEDEVERVHRMFIGS